MCVRNEKSWNIEPNKTNSSFKILNNNVTKIVLKYWTKRYKESLLLNLFLSLMWLKGISILFIECFTWQNLILSCMRSLFIYIYIYINSSTVTTKFLYKVVLRVWKMNKNSRGRTRKYCHGKKINTYYV